MCAKGCPHRTRHDRGVGGRAERESHQEGALRAAPNQDDEVQCLTLLCESKAMDQTRPRQLLSRREFFEAVFGPAPNGSMATPKKSKVSTSTTAVLATATATAAVAVATGGASVVTATATAASAALAAVQAKRVIKKSKRQEVDVGPMLPAPSVGMQFAKAQDNFIRSLATYSLLCYLLRVRLPGGCARPTAAA